VEERPDLADLGARPQRQLNWPGIVRGLVVPLAILALIVGGLWYWQNRGSGPSHDPYGTVQLPAEKNPTGQSPAPRIGRAAPDFLLEQPAGGTLRLSDLQGHPVLINFWASWCAPCRQEVPELVAAYQKYHAQGLIIVGVDLQEADKKVLDFANEFGITYPIAIDRDGEVGGVWRIGGPIKGLPSSYFIDSQGVVQDSYPGQLTKDLLDKKLAKILPAGTS
jgi:thiol-disulfide isomerase/thioredoxin